MPSCTPITAVYTSGTNDPYVSNTSKLDEEIDPDFALTGPAAAVPSSSDLTYAATVLPDGTNSPTGTFDFSIVGQPQSFTNVNLSDAAHGETFTGLAAGTYTVTVTYHGDANYHACTLTRTLVVAEAPTIATLAPVTVSSATSAALSVPSPSSDPSVIYGWSVDSDPAGAADPTFSANLSHAASTSVATFSQAGEYKLRATVANAAGLAASTSFTVTVNATLTSIAVTPPPWILPSGDGQQQFTAAARDQFGDAMTGTSFNWSTSRGAFDGDVLCYNAAAGSGGTVTATAGGASGSTPFWIEDVSAISASGAATANANMPYMLNLGSAGLYCNPITSWTIAWGDGSDPETISSSPLPAAVPHVYTFQPESAIEVTAFSPAVEGHPATTYSTTAYGGTPVSVEISTPALPLGGEGRATLGEAYGLTLGDGQTDLGSGGDVSYNIYWGDGGQTTVTADDLAAANDRMTHVFTAASYGISVTLAVDGNLYYYVGTKSLTFDASNASTTTLSLGNVSPDFLYGETLVATVAAAVSGTPGGTVEFYDGTIDLGTGTLDQNGMATLSTWPLALGEHDFTAVYGGDGTFYGSTSAPLSVSMSYPCGAGNLTLSGDSSVAEGGTYILHLPATTPGNAAIGQWSIDWGDGTATAFRDHPSSTTHVYGVPGTFTIAASAVDSGGTVYAAARNGGAVTVWAVGPSIVSLTVDHASYCGADTIDGSGLAPDQLHFAFTGPASAESYSVTINWGDGTEQNPDLTTFALAPGETSFDYPLPQYVRTGAYGIKVTVTDEDGHSATNAVPIPVHYSNVRPSGLTASFDEATIYVGNHVTLSGSFIDVQWNCAHTVTIDWGDAPVGSPPDISTFDLSPGETTFNLPPHTYVTPGTYIRAVTIAGADGTVTRNDTVVVHDVPDQVMIGSLVPSAAEDPQRNQKGVFMITRVGGTAESLTVHFTVPTTMEGSAVAGTDYVAIGTSVTIPAGQTSVTILVNPIDRLLTSGHCTVTIALSDDAGYSVVDAYRGALVTIWDDDPAPPPPSGGDPPWLLDEAIPYMTCFKTDGTEAGQSASTAKGAFIIFGIKYTSGDPSLGQSYMSYDETKFIVSATSDGSEVIPSGYEFTLTKSYTIYYVFAAGSDVGQAAAQADGQEVARADAQEVAGEVDVEAYSSQHVHINALFDGLHILRDGIDVTDGSPTQDCDKLAVDVGEQINLSVSPPIGITIWDVPGEKITSYIANNAVGVVIPFLNTPLPVVSYAWVDGGRETVTAAVIWPFGICSANATFEVIKPSVEVKAEGKNVDNILGGTGYVTLANGSGGINMFQCSYTKPIPGRPDLPDKTINTGTITFACVPTNDLKDLRQECGAQFTAEYNDSDFRYAWVQVIHSLAVSKQHLVAKKLYRPDSWKISTTWDELDNRFPYSNDPNQTVDNPRYAVDADDLDLLHFESVEYAYRIDATMWYVCQPLAGGNWIPLAKADWSAGFTATGTGSEVPKNTRWEIKGAAHVGNAQSTAGANEFPTWILPFVNGTGADPKWTPRTS